VGQPDNLGTVVAVDIEAPDAGARMCAHDRVLDGRIALDRCRVGGLAALPAREVEDAFEALDASFHGIG
jgi:CubicO group peptidase (beta-lactamase class C family)